MPCVNDLTMGTPDVPSEQALTAAEGGHEIVEARYDTVLYPEFCSGVEKSWFVMDDLDVETQARWPGRSMDHAISLLCHHLAAPDHIARMALTRTVERYRCPDNHRTQVITKQDEATYWLANQLSSRQDSLYLTPALLAERRATYPRGLPLGHVAVAYSANRILVIKQTVRSIEPPGIQYDKPAILRACLTQTGR
ncbi:hypothetical protein OIV83_002994 [Microbotryomycetes sp. JL201]|nr:hypothetical protein OIV83_002994 [Microbotryomycetes sp. JL201]